MERVSILFTGAARDLLKMTWKLVRSLVAES